MRPSTRICLLCISLLCSVSQVFADDYLLSLGGRQEYMVTISARGAELSGICIIRTDEGGSRGTIMNEFGVNALDFTLSADRKKVRLQHVVAMMDKWYVKRVVRKDLQYLFSATMSPQTKGRRTVVRTADGSVTLENEKYKLKYSLKPINRQDNEIAE